MEVDTIEFQAGANNEGKPFVHLFINGKRVGQLTPRETLDHGIRAIQAAQEAERDAAIIVGMQREYPDDPAHADRLAAAMLHMIRENRGQVDPDPAKVPTGFHRERT